MNNWLNKKNRIKLKLKTFPLLFKILYLIWSRINIRIIKTKKEKLQFKNLLNRILPQDEIFFVQVGSNDGISNDPLREHIIKYDWNGILIEPSPIPFRKLEKLYESNHKVETKNLAISESGENLKFYIASPALLDDINKGKVPKWYDQLGSFVRQNIEKHFIQNGISTEFIEEIPVITTTLDLLLEDRGINKLDVLHVDAEGYDIEVLNSIDLEKIETNIIIFEHMHIEISKKNEFIEYLKGLGYKIHIFHDDAVAEKL